MRTIRFALPFFKPACTSATNGMRALSHPAFRHRRRAIIAWDLFSLLMAIAPCGSALAASLVAANTPPAIAAYGTRLHYLIEERPWLHHLYSNSDIGGTLTVRLCIAPDGHPVSVESEGGQTGNRVADPQVLKLMMAFIYPRFTPDMPDAPICFIMPVVIKGEFD